MVSRDVVFLIYCGHDEKRTNEFEYLPIYTTLELKDITYMYM